MSKKISSKNSEDRVSKLTKIQSNLELSLYVVPKDEVVECVKTPSDFINNQTGGFPKGLFSFVNGSTSSGKTTFLIQTIAYNQALNPDFTTLIIDAEHAFHVEYAKSLGVDMEKVDVIRTPELKTAFDIIRSSCFDLEKFDSKKILNNTFKKNYDLIVVDSIDSLQTEEDIENENIGGSRMGNKPFALGNCLRKTLTPIHHSKTALVFINQFRKSLNAYSGDSIPGGEAQQYYAYVRLDFRSGSPLKTGDKVYGNEVKVKVYKNKNGEPKADHVMELHYGKGFNFIGSTFNTAVELGIIKKSGSWFSYQDVKLGQGKPSAIELLESNEELLAEIKSKVDEKI